MRGTTCLIFHRRLEKWPYGSKRTRVGLMAAWNKAIFFSLRRPMGIIIFYVLIYACMRVQWDIFASRSSVVGHMSFLLMQLLVHLRLLTAPLCGLHFPLNILCGDVSRCESVDWKFWINSTYWKSRKVIFFIFKRFVYISYGNHHWNCDV